jgi:hypothetical protein
MRAMLHTNKQGDQLVRLHLKHSPWDPTNSLSTLPSGSMRRVTISRLHALHSRISWNRRDQRSNGRDGRAGEGGKSERWRVIHSSVPQMTPM